MARPWITVSKLSDGIKTPSETKNPVYQQLKRMGILMIDIG
ncbi:hypothetical protein RBU49_01675 [Clostridium sp. MB40-C1]|nr:hypothetical protein [Clostridium sp. MB40-C1]WMJ80988.1 hypothetical protein RBU49_01675 [Clostridium sp. MB40-C1]